MRAVLRPVLLAFGLAALFSGSMAQQMYRWVDKEGRVHYTQQPPARDAAKSVEKRRIGSGSSGEARAPRTTAP